MDRKENKGWLFQKASNSFTVSILVLAYAYFLIVLNRWMFTSLGLKSYGRVWQYYVSYVEVGFVRRALLGTILCITRLNVAIRNEYAFAHVFTAILGIACVSLIYCLMKDAGLSRALAIGIAFAPPLLAHFGYFTGSLVFPLFLLLCIAILYARNMVVVLVITTIGILTHEAFLFYVPFLAAMTMAARADETGKEDARIPVAITAFSFLVLLGLRLFSAPPMDASQYASMMAAKIPRAAYQHPYWSGYFELYSTVPQNIGLGNESMKLLFTKNGVLAFIPFAYAILLAGYCIKSISAGVLTKIATGFGIVFPFFACFVAADFLRWVCMSAGCALLAIIVFSKRGRMNVRDRFSSVLLAFCLLSPFGAVEPNWAFPLQQFILEKVYQRIR